MRKPCLTGHGRGVTVTRMSTQENRPSTRRIVEIVAEAGPAGILAVDVSAQFIPPDVDGLDRRYRQDIQSWVNILLSRQLYYGNLYRTKHREKPEPGSGRTRSSFRWFLTEQGEKYVHPDPAPEVVPFQEPPTSRRVLELLAGAGEEGMTGPVIGRHFTLDYDKYTSLSHSDNLQRRLNWSNQILHRFWGKGFVERGGKEISPFYHNVPAFRWFITDKGREYLEGGMAHGRAQRREAAVAAERERRAERRRHADSMLTQAYVEHDPATTPQCVRSRVIGELREAGCTLDQVGGLFDLTRERVRQIQVGIGVGPCRCPKHNMDGSGVGWPS